MGKPAGWLDEPHMEESAPGDACPLLSWDEAGVGSDVSGTGPDGARATYRCPVRCGPETYVLRVRGAGMEPRFRKGELLYVDPGVPPEAGRYVVASREAGGEAMLRQLVESAGRRYLRALNPDWPQPVIEAGEAVCVRGVVVFKGESV